ncbi:TPA: hypothetical protein ACXNQL_001891 [Stenotrophomonas maltophilia]
MIPVACVSNTSERIVKVAEARSTHATFENDARAEYKLIRFDGCVINNALACDWIVEKAAVGRVAVELKGSDVKHAVDQIAAALQFLKNNGLTDLKLGALVVCTRAPASDTTIQRLKEMLARKFNVPLQVKRDARGLEFERLLRYGR